MENLIARTLKNYRVLSSGPAELKSASNDVLALLGCLNLVASELRNTFPSEEERQSLESLRTKGNSVLVGLERALARSRLNGGELEDISGIQSQLLEQAEEVKGIYDVLRSRSQKRVLEILSQIQELRNSEGSNVPEWTVLANELESHGLEKELIEEEFYLINSWFKENHPEEVEQGMLPVLPVVPTAVEDDLPGYSPGAQKGTIDEKVQALEQTSLLLSTPLPTEAVASSSKAEPPPYTFEDGSDDLLDENFSEYIQAAIRNESNMLSVKASNYIPCPWSWLPAHLQTQYSKKIGVHQRMDPHSFSIMAYETAPRCLQEIERLKRLVRTSFDTQHTEASGAIGEAFRSLDVMFAGISKVMMLQDQSPSQQRFSDLDFLLYEGSTVRSVFAEVDFPDAQIELVQKSCYQMLTYIMGFMNAFSSLYTGRTYVMKSPKELESSWKALKMDTRVAWVKKKLSGWNLVEIAVQSCREFHSSRPGLRPQALTILSDWETAKKILDGSENDQIEVTIISALALPKTGFKTPTAWVKVVLYGFNKSTMGTMAVSVSKTATADKGQYPEWNKCFLIDAPPSSRMLQVEVCDRSLGIDKELSRIILHFSSISGEANLANRSLLYGLDEEIDFPLKIFEGKGKEKEQPMLRLGLRWKGRYHRLEELGLPTQAPGKMFSSEQPRNPLLSELPSSTPSHRASSSRASGHS